MSGRQSRATISNLHGVLAENLLASSGSIPERSRIFETGRGSGDLAQRLAQAGHQLVAIAMLEAPQRI